MSTDRLSTGNTASTGHTASTGNTALTSNSAVKRVLVIDSGVGGLSICREIIARQASMQLVYIADNAGFPYGELQRESLVERVSHLVGHAVKQFAPDAIVLACNTASTVALPALREQFAIPVVGVVPAIKTAANLSQSKTIGLLATQGTVQRNYTHDLIADFAGDCEVISLGSSILVEHIEAHVYGQDLQRHIVNEVLQGFHRHPHAAAMDTVVLGCTHFPLIIDTLLDLQPNWRWIDSGNAIAARLIDILGVDEHSPANNSGGSANSSSREQAEDKNSPHRLFFTESSSDTRTTAQLGHLARYTKALGFGSPARFIMS